MLTVAKYDRTEGYLGDLAYYIFNGQPTHLRASADGIDLEMIAQVADEGAAYQAVLGDIAAMPYQGWLPDKPRPADAAYFVPELRSIIKCENRYR